MSKEGGYKRATLACDSVGRHMQRLRFIKYASDADAEVKIRDDRGQGDDEQLNVLLQSAPLAIGV